MAFFKKSIHVPNDDPGAKNLFRVGDGKVKEIPVGTSAQKVKTYKSAATASGEAVDVKFTRGSLRGRSLKGVDKNLLT